MGMAARVAGADLSRRLDAVFINSPLKDYDCAPRLNDFTLPVLGLGYLATYAASQDLNVAVLDAEALGLGLNQVADTVNALMPRWVGLNLLAPTYRHSVSLLGKLAPDIKVMLGGHQAKAMPHAILADEAIPRIDALVLGEGDSRAAALLENLSARERLPGVLWRGGTGRAGLCESRPQAGSWLAPDLEALPLLDRRFLVDDPFLAEDGRLEAAVVGSRGCPYDCAFCGAAISANPDVRWRLRTPANILAELEALHRAGVQAVRFVDDLFLAHPRFMREALSALVAADVPGRMVWDATGRINVLARAPEELLDLMAAAGCREVALGIESGSAEVLARMDKRITPAMTERVLRRLSERGIGVKGYFILGFPGESREDLAATEAHIRRLWQIADKAGGRLRASAFEFRPYPGTPIWHQLLAEGQYSAEQLMDYQHVDLSAEGVDEALRARDEFNFSSQIQFGQTPLGEMRAVLARIAREQHERNARTGAAATRAA
jgi:radical SAM superfamily enzyme YgiQ (UPF0313 family)